MRSLTSYRAEQEYERLKSRVATLEYEVARLRDRLNDHDHDDVIFSEYYEGEGR